jgi:iron complex outermembrane receptor protein
MTGRKREESLQEIPVAVTAFTSETIQSLGIRNMRDLKAWYPANLGGSTNGVKATATPISAVSGSARQVTDGGVGIYLDGFTSAHQVPCSMGR